MRPSDQSHLWKIGAVQSMIGGREYGVSVSETGEETPINTSAVPLFDSVMNQPSVPYNPWVCPLCGSEELEQDAVLSVNGPEDGMIVSTGDIWCTNDQCRHHKFEIEPIRKADYNKENNTSK